MQFQWDILLLEAGFLTIFFAPLIPGDTPGPFAKIIRELIRWLTFRLMLSSGLTKLLSGCPTWWNLTALHYHFETQPLPNYVSWYAHNLDDGLKRFGTLDTHFVEIIVPLMFYFPLRSVRIFAGVRTHLLMFMIMLTGNYNFFNILTMVINLVNFDDEFLSMSLSPTILKLLNIKYTPKPQKSSKLSKFLLTTLPITLIILISTYLEVSAILDSRDLTQVLKIPFYRTFYLSPERLKFFLQSTPYPLYFFYYI